jgi:hypothetical protein
MAFCSPTRLSPRILRWYQAGSDELKVEVLGPHRFSAVLYWSGKIQTSPRHVMWYFFPRLPAILGSGKDSFLHHSLRDATNNGNDLSFLSTLFFSCWRSKFALVPDFPFNFGYPWHWLSSIWRLDQGMLGILFSLRCDEEANYVL